MLLGQQAMEQAMPATGLGPLGGPMGHASMGQYPGPGAYHPGYMQQVRQSHSLLIGFTILQHCSDYDSAIMFL